MGSRGGENLYTKFPTNNGNFIVKKGNLVFSEQQRQSVYVYGYKNLTDDNHMAHLENVFAACILGSKEYSKMNFPEADHLRMFPEYWDEKTEFHGRTERYIENLQILKICLSNMGIDPKPLALTPQQRLDAYVWAYKNFMKVNTGPYLCNVLISYVMGDFRYTAMNFPNENIMHLFPELLKQKPSDTKPLHPWWTEADANIKRMEALRNAVVMVKDLIDLA